MKQYSQNLALLAMLNKCPDASGDNIGLSLYLTKKGVIVPPCAIGDPIYILVRSSNLKNWHVKRSKLSFSNLERVLRDYGDSVFTDRAEAYKALAELNSGKSCDACWWRNADTGVCACDKSGQYANRVSDECTCEHWEAL